MFKKFIRYLDLEIQLLEKRLEIALKMSNEADAKKQWDLETGAMFNDLISKYPILEEELLSISETVAKFVTLTRITNIDKYLFTDNELTQPRRKLM